MSINNWIYLNNINWGDDGDDNLNEAPKQPWLGIQPQPDAVTPGAGKGEGPGGGDGEEEEGEGEGDWWEDPNHPNWQNIAQWLQDLLYEMLKKNPDLKLIPWWMIEDWWGFIEGGFEAWLEDNPGGTWQEFLEHNIGVVSAIMQELYQDWLEDNPDGNWFEFLQDQDWWPQFQQMFPSWMWPYLPSWLRGIFPYQGDPDGEG